MSDTETSGEYRRGPEEHRYHPEKYDGRLMPRGPIGTVPESAPPAAIGFCPLCATNARGTTGVRGIFDCPKCTFFWYDDRVGEQTRSFEDFIGPA